MPTPGQSPTSRTRPDHRAISTSLPAAAPRNARLADLREGTELVGLANTARGQWTDQRQGRYTGQLASRPEEELHPSREDRVNTVGEQSVVAKSLTSVNIHEKWKNLLTGAYLPVQLAKRPLTQS